MDMDGTRKKHPAVCPHGQQSAKITTNRVLAENPGHC